MVVGDVYQFQMDVGVFLGVGGIDSNLLEVVAILSQSAVLPDGVYQAVDAVNDRQIRVINIDNYCIGNAGYAYIVAGLDAQGERRIRVGDNIPLSEAAAYVRFQVDI
ncbi:hypothetical protein ES703_53125 [subsurface metagenome]